MRAVSAHFFFFSSRRRHTRCSRDWSSDVCSSDLVGQRGTAHIENGEKIRGKDALPIRQRGFPEHAPTEIADIIDHDIQAAVAVRDSFDRSEEHTSELQSRLHLVCRLLLEKKKSSRTPRPLHR